MDLHYLGSKTSHTEHKMEDFTTAHNDLTNHVEQLRHQLARYETKIMDLEDRSRRCYTCLRGIFEDVINQGLAAYLTGLFNTLFPELPVAMLLMDRAHRMVPPQLLPPSTARDVF
ncbi:Hypothetical predicted protein, partial [Pelobates cultripes]